MEMTPTEIRVLGSLVEKAATTPDQYPLSLNSLLLACNQKTNRDPVVTYVDADVIEGINALRDRGLCRLVHTPGQRVVKYKHAADEVLGVDAPDAALLAVLMLRGQQTPGELRARTTRYHDFASLAEVETRLDDLCRRQPPLVERLERRAGEKESRYRHLLGPDTSEPEAVPVDSATERAPAATDELMTRVAGLETEVARLADIVERLADLLE